jgi:hypothetical protein
MLDGFDEIIPSSKETVLAFSAGSKADGGRTAVCPHQTTTEREIGR